MYHSYQSKQVHHYSSNISLKLIFFLKGNYYYIDTATKEKKELEYIPGFLEDNAGSVDTIIGQVKNFNATVNQQGSFQCTIDLVSQNTTLLDQEITDENKSEHMLRRKKERRDKSVCCNNKLFYVVLY